MDKLFANNRHLAVNMYVMIFKLLVITAVFASVGFAQMPAIEPGVSHDLAKRRAAR